MDEWMDGSGDFSFPVRRAFSSRPGKMERTYHTVCIYIADAIVHPI